eukprot:868688-Amphidinium_carterae.1
MQARNPTEIPERVKQVTLADAVRMWCVSPWAFASGGSRWAFCAKQKEQNLSKNKGMNEIGAS